MQLLSKPEIPTLIQKQVRDIFIYKNTLHQEVSYLTFSPQLR